MIFELFYDTKCDTIKANANARVMSILLIIIKLNIYNTKTNNNMILMMMMMIMMMLLCNTLLLK